MSIAYPKTEETRETGEAAGRLGRARGGELSLDEMTPGEPARVVAVDGSGPVARRLMEMGVVPGAPVCVIRAAPLGDPLEVRVRNYHLALRRTEARTIKVVSGSG